MKKIPPPPLDNRYPHGYSIRIPHWVYREGFFMNRAMEALERFLELGGIKKDITLLVISGAAVVGSLLQ